MRNEGIGSTTIPVVAGVLIVLGSLAQGSLSGFAWAQLAIWAIISATGLMKLREYRRARRHFESENGANAGKQDTWRGAPPA